MDKKSLRIVYMGTPDFAVESLKSLVNGGYNVVGVITMPDKRAGRGHKLFFSPVKEFALTQGIPILQPEKLKDESFLTALRAWKADLQIVVAFRMLPEVVWDMPRLGTFNLHASLLPQYRGAAPINWAVMNGETKTGVTTFFLKHEIDTGKIIFQEEIEIPDQACVGDIHDQLMEMGARLVVKTVDAILDNTLQTVEQEQLIDQTLELKSAPKIFKETCRIDWKQPAKRIYDFIRGLSPYPAAWTEILHPESEQPATIKIFETEKRICNHHRKDFGAIVSDGKTFVDIVVLDGYVRLLSVQLAGKKRLEISEFLRGFPLNSSFRCL